MCERRYILNHMSSATSSVDTPTKHAPLRSQSTQSNHLNDPIYHLKLNKNYHCTKIEIFLKLCHNDLWSKFLVHLPSEVEGFDVGMEMVTA